MTRSRQFLLAANLLTALSGAGCSADKTGSASDHGDAAHASGTGGSAVPATSGSALAGTGAVRGSTAGSPANAGFSGGASGNAGQSGNASATSGATNAGAGGASQAGTGSSGNGATGGETSTNAGASAPVCVSSAPKQFELNMSIGGGGSQHKDSDHFALYAASNPDVVLNFMEAAHKCFIEDWCFRTPGLSSKSDDSGPYYKTNIYSDPTMQAGGLTYWDDTAELAYIHILAAQISDPRTTVHEYGHAITMSEHNWIDQKRTGYWWETVANWVAYSFLTSPYCQDARTAFGVDEATTIIDQMHTLDTVYGQSYTVICNDQNYYRAWPFLTYLTNNPDNYPGLGKMAVADLMRKYQLKSNETPLHTLERIASPIKVQTILGRYWARMAYMDIGLPVGQKDFLSSRSSLKYSANLDSAADQTYMVKAARKPQYGGANMSPLKVSGTGDVSVTVTNLGNGLQESNFTATLAIRSSDGSVRYVDLPKGTGQATVASSEEASLVVVNTPDMLYQFDPQSVGSPENVGLNYKVQMTGATPSD
jgi:Family of unknown function (DUF6055)